MVSMAEWSNPTRYQSEAFKSNKKNLKDNKHRGKVSPKAMKDIKNSVNWLIHAAKQKMFFHKESNRTYSFKVNFITLTLPDSNKEISSATFQKELLEPLLATLRKGYGLKNYVWKLELQANGKIHAHLTTDTFIYWKDLRRLWNKRLASIGVIKAYKEKFSGCSFDQYVSLCSDKDQRSLNDKRISWERSTAANWSDPNSTDVHAVHQVKDLAAYISKYMAKDSDKLKDIKGRIWGCNYQISRNRKPRLFLDRHATCQSISSLFKKQIQYSPITLNHPVTGLPKQIGEIFFLTQADWRYHIQGELRILYDKIIASLQNESDLFEFNPVVVSSTSVQ